MRGLPFVLFAALVTLAASEAIGQVQGSYRSNVSVETWIERIKAEPDHLNRAGLAGRMAYDIATLRPELAASTVDGIIALLDDESDLVRDSIAKAVARIEPPPTRAIPALERAFEKGLQHARQSGIDGVIVGGAFSVDAICTALATLSARNVPQGCDRGGYNPPSAARN